MTDTGYKVNSDGTYVDLKTLFEPYVSGPQAIETKYKIPTTNKDLNEIFAPYVSDPKSILTYYKNSADKDLNEVFEKLKKWDVVGSGNLGFNDLVRAIVVDSSGNIYVG